MNNTNKPTCFQDIFNQLTLKQPEKIAVSSINNSITYEELNKKANGLANYLKKIGIEREDRIAIICERNIETIIGIVAILKVGAAYVPIDISLPYQRKRFIIEDSSPSAILIGNEKFETSSSIPLINLFDYSLYVCSDDMNIQSNLHDLALVIYTSGTTGKPKGVMIEHSRFIKNKIHFENYLKITNEDVVLQFASLSYAASFEEMTMALLSGAELCTIPYEIILDTQNFEQYIHAHKISVLMVPPQYLLNFNNLDVKIIITSGGTATIDLMSHILHCSEYHNNFGSSEIGMMAWWSLSKNVPDKIIPLGKPINNTMIYIANGNKLCSVMEKGQIFVTGLGMARGYLNQTQLTTEKFVENPFGEGKLFKSGDFGRWLPDGNIEYLGRMDEQVKIQGHRIELREIENVIRKQLLVEDCTVISKEYKDNEKIICAFVVGSNLDTFDLKKSLQKILPDYMIPSYIVHLDKLPLNKNGKIDKMKLSNFDFATIKVFEEEKSVMEIVVSNAFCEILKLKSVGLNSNFFELGGHSLRAMKLVNKIEADTGIRFSFQTLLSNPTVRQISHYLNEQSLNYYISIPKVSDKEYYPMSSTQKRIFLINQIESNGIAYNMPQYLKLKGNVQIDKIKEVVENLIKRHEILRTEFHVINGEMYQRILETADLEFKIIKDEKRTEKSIFSSFIRPFDLGKAPLVRVEVIKREDGYLLLIDMHHIISDGMSMSTFFKELCSLYNGDELEEARQYKDYSEWNRLRDFSRQREYWLNQLTDEIPVLNMPLDFERPKEKNFDGKMVYQSTSKELGQKIKNLSKSTKTTLYMILLSVAMVTLSKYSLQEDIIIGSPVSARVHKDTEKMLGMFANTLAIRGKPEGKKRYIDFLYEIKDTCLNGYENQEYPFDELVDALNIQRDISRNPLFDVMLVLQNHEKIDYHLKEINVEVVQSEGKMSKFDLTFNITEQDNIFNIGLEYCTALFNEQNAKGILNHYIEFLNYITNKPYVQLEKLEIVTEEERKLILEVFNNTKVAYRKDQTVVKLFDKQVDQNPENIALEYEDENITYQQLNTRANYIAQQLMELDIGSNDFVAIVAERSIEMIVGILGIIKAGGAYVPIDPTYPKERIKYILDDCNPKAILLYQTLIITDIPVIDLAENQVFNGMHENPKLIYKSDDLVYCIYTSGTSGKPKGVLIDNKNIISMHQYLTTLYEANQKDKILQFFNYTFDGFVWEFIIALLSGATLCLISNEIINDIMRFNNYIEKKEITIAALPPQYFSQSSICNLRILVTAGSESNYEVVRIALDNKRYINEYGPTENTVQATYWEYDPKGVIPQKIPIGRPILNTQIYIMNGDILCGIGMPGELCIAGDGLARGYLNQPKLTAEKFKKNPFGAGRMYRSGDLARWIFDGNIEYLGRIDDQIKIRGYRIELGEIENKLRKINGIKDVAVIMYEDHNSDKAIYAYVVSDELVNIREIRNQLCMSLPIYMVPSYIQQIDKIPTTRSGKLDKCMLTRTEVKSSKLYVAPRDQTESILCHAFENVLGIDKVSVEDSFFELGGNSLNAMRIINKIELEIGIRLPLKTLFVYNTVATLRKQINTDFSLYEPIPEIELKDYYAMSSTQKRLYFLNQIEGGGTTYNMPHVLKLKGNLNVAALKSALFALIVRHEILRTEFTILNGELVQHIKPSVELDYECFEYIEDNNTEEKLLFSKYIQPFDLEKGPLVRVKLIKKEQDYLLFIDIHHIICDGISINIFIEELFTLYNGKKLINKARQYKDYSEWMRSRDLSKQREYWLSEFIDDIPVLNMPLDFARPKEQSFRGETICRTTGTELRKKIRTLSRITGATTYMILLSAAMVTLSKYSSQEDIVIGSPISVRTHKDTEKMIGMFVNTLIMRGKPTGKKQYTEFLEEIKATCLKSYENQEYSFEELVESLNIQRDISRNPIFDVMLVLQSNDEIQYNLNSLDIETIPIQNNTAKFDLTFNITEQNDIIDIELEYCTDLYNKDNIKGILSHYIDILEQISEKPNVLIGDLEMVTKEERQLILGKFNATKKNYSRNMTVAELFEEQVDRTPENVALVYEEKKLTYSELNTKINQIARKLRALGVGPDNFVAIIAERGIEMIIGIFAIIKAGGVYVPIDPTYPEERIKYILNDCKAKVVLLYQTELEVNPEMDIIKIDLANSQVFVGMSNNLERTNNPEDLVYCIYTSGTTGNPKGVLIENKGILSMQKYLIELYKINATDHVLQFSNYIFDAFIWEITISLLSGATLCLISNTSIKDILKFNNIIEIYKISIILLPPNFFLQTEIKNLKVITTGGSESNSEIINKISKNTRYINAYGPTENTVLATHWEYNMKDTPLKVPIGRPISNTQIYIMSGEKLCGIGIPGELCISGDGLARGYLNHPRLTREKFVKNPFGEGRLFRSGDLAKWLSDGNIEFLGRIDDQVKIRGFRIELGEIESRLRKIEEIQDTAVIVREDNDGDKIIYGYFVSNKQIDINDIRIKLSKYLPDYMIPTYLIQINKLPMTRNGKLDKRALYKVEIETKNNYIEPSNEIESTLCMDFQAVLGIGKIGVADNFFELGGHSLRAIKLVNKIEADTGIRIPLKILFKNPTVRKIAQYLTEHNVGDYHSIPTADNRDYYPMSSTQKRTYLVNQMDKQGIAYNMPQGLKLSGEIKFNDIKLAFEKLIKRHEILRTEFTIQNGELVQKIQKKIKLDLIYTENAQESEQEIFYKFVRPFDLSKTPLVRMELIKRKADYLLLIDMHHIIGDGMSMDIFIQELCKLYNREQLENDIRQYKDYSQWMRSRDFTLQQEYWVNIFSGEIPVLNMPLDYVRPQKQTFEGNSIYDTTGPELRKKINNLASKTGTTTYMILLSVAMITLSKYSRQEDIIIGSPVSARLHKDTEKMLGMFINTLVMRGKPVSQKYYIDFLLEIKEICLKAYENQEYPFEELVETLKVNRDVSRNPLFDVMLVFQNSDKKQYDFNGVNVIDFIKPNSKVAKFDLTFNIFESDDRIGIDLEYCTALYNKDSVIGILKHYINLLEQAVKQPNVLIEDLQTITQEEYRLVLRKFNDTKAEYPKNKTIVELFEEQVVKTPENTAIVYEDKYINFRELNERANQLAQRLRKFSVGANDIIAIISQRSIEMIIGIFGIIKAGGAYVPIDPLCPNKRIQFILGDCQPKAILIYEAEIQTEIPLIDLANSQVFTGISENPVKINKPEDLVYCIYTSGSTGNPKGVLIENRSLNNYLHYARINYLDQNINMPLFTNISFDLSATSLFLPLLFGGRLEVFSDDVSKIPEEAMRTGEYSCIKMTPSHLKMYMEPKEKIHVTKLKSIIVGGEKLESFIASKIWIKFGEHLKIHNEYGPTETTIGCCDYIYSASDKTLCVPIGRPISNTQIYIMNGNNLCGIGIPGELCIAGDGLARGYLNQIELTEEKFMKNPFAEGRMYRSGDLARWMNDGNIEYLGRIDRQVKVRGFRVELSEIESKLYDIKEIKDVAVIDRKDDNGNSVLYGYIVCDVFVNINRIREKLADLLPNYMIPTYLMQIEKLPLTQNGKLDRKALPIMKLRNEKEYIAPRNQVETVLCQVFKEVLNIDKVGVKDNFFDLGGDSIKAIRIVSKLRVFGYEVTIKDVMQESVVEKIAKLSKVVYGVNCEQKQINGPIISTPIIKEFQKWNLKKPEHYNQSIVLRLGKFVEDESIKKTLYALVEHHDILRAVYNGKLEILNMKISNLYDYEVIEIEQQSIEEQLEVECTRIQKSIDLKNGPLMKVALCHILEEYYLLVVIHHLVVDAISWNILVEDFFTGLSQARNGELITLPLKTVSFKEWSEALVDYSKKIILKSEKNFWEKILFESNNGRLKDLNRGKYRKGVINFKLTISETKKLTKKTRKAFTTEINDLLLSALGMAFFKVRGQEKLTIMLEGHGREQIHKRINIDRTVGWFTSIYPVILSCMDNIENSIISTKDKLRVIPNHGLGFGLLKDLLPDIQADVYFNYLGEIDTEFGWEDFFYLSKTNIAEENRINGVISFNGYIIQEQLNFVVNYDQSKVSKNEIKSLALTYRKCLNQIIKYCIEQKTTKMTISDYSVKDLSLNELLNIYKQLELSNGEGDD